MMVKISVSRIFNMFFKMNLVPSSKRDVCILMTRCETSKFSDLPVIESEQDS